MTVEALVLDFDGVIIDSMTTLVASWHEEYAAAGVAMDPTSIRVCIGMAGFAADPYKWLGRRAGRDYDIDLSQKRRRARERELTAALPVLAGVADWVAQARTMGLPVAIASGSTRPWVEGHLQRLGMLEAFDAVLCRDDVEQSKPAPDLYLTAARRVEVSPTACLAVEDSVVGVAAALAAGCRCVVVPNGVTADQDLRGAHLHLHSLAERGLPDVIETLGAQLP
jgi:HAD superfamily hydrolase (TIGR01509 family)